MSSLTANTGGKKPSTHDFLFGRVLGEGAFAKVLLAQYKSANKDDLFAAKIMDIRFILKHGKTAAVLREVQLLQTLSHPNILRLFSSFRATDSLIMITELCSGGELRKVIDFHREKCTTKDFALPVRFARFYLSEIITGLRYLHEKRVVHRDLKPENILLSSSGHIKIVDFGSALNLRSCDQHLRVAFVGSAEYVSPEVLRDEAVDIGCDIWAVGCIFFHMLVGRPPFKGESEYLTFQEIGNFCPQSFFFPPSIGLHAKTLILSFLTADSSLRLGAGKMGSGNDYPALMSHPFFSEDPSFKWSDLHRQDAPYIPSSPSYSTPSRDGSNLNFSLLDLDEQFEDDSCLNTKHENSVPKSPMVSELQTKVDVDKKWGKYIFDGEQVLHCGKLWKRRYFSTRLRFFILLSGGVRPRYIYFDEEEMEFKGEIPWSRDLIVDVIGTKKFDVITPDRTYHLSDESGNVHSWVSAIKLCMKHYYPNSDD
jgi:3-phosphoinositide dependent protein kinase-1